jgi:hypothetical protein
MYFPQVVNDWRALYSFIKAFGKSRQLYTAYQDIEELANEWAINRLATN